MSKMIILVMADGGKASDVLQTWAQAGVSGATILDSSGIGRQLAARDDLPLIPSIRAVLRAQERTHRTIISVVPDSFDLSALIRATEAVTGSLAAPHTGILIVLPVAEVYGLRENESLFSE
ncbi:MAG: hypothetical protein JETCAE02_25690 [Anaerolineaceae bacterium]|nr:hypothetical protein [Anaerolineae bacterium]MBL1172824.1 hypothetical protein [Chloroflexota bacterium]MCL4822811.1 hypothetical protein [Anaerolineales bacterium]MDL1926637.1 hypothetical protein [Anaerolineae bacterium AMX1]GJQ40157.1 MAG: hypothetical protein JETCAE02_25690 [Anaerolineaceae bacterium]